jgi:hypothetical protein
MDQEVFLEVEEYTELLDSKESMDHSEGSQPKVLMGPKSGAKLSSFLSSLRVTDEFQEGKRNQV